MRTSTTATLIGLLLLGCSTEHTIANETGTDQPMAIAARPLCVDMCNHSLSCGSLTEDTVTSCLMECEQSCSILDTKEAVQIDMTTGAVTSGPEFIEKTIGCFLDSACEMPSNCSLWHLSCAAGNCKTPQSPASLGTVSMTSCGMQENQLECKSSLAQGTDPLNSIWELSCTRADVTATEWTCTCYEYGVEVATKVGTPTQTDVAMFGLCWSKERLSCFYSNATGC